jgi:hypothetical protein
VIGPTLVGRSNESRGAATVRAIGFRGDQLAEVQAVEAGDFAGFEYAHAVLRLRRAPGSWKKSELRALTVGEDTFVGGTVASWARALDNDAADVSRELRAAVIAALARGCKLPLFGAARLLPPLTKDAEYVTPDELPAVAMGGIVTAWLDAPTQQALVDAGARILAAVAASDNPPFWSRRAHDRAVRSAAGDVVLALPMAPDSLSAADLKLFKSFHAAYTRLQIEATARPLADALRLPLEAQEVLLVIDGAILDAAAAHASPTVRTAAAAIRTAFATGRVLEDAA